MSGYGGRGRFTGGGYGRDPRKDPRAGFERRPPKPTVHPRKVVGGIRLKNDGVWSDEGSGWAAARWMRLVESVAPGEALASGLAYAKSGQTKLLEVEPGLIRASVQGRLTKPYEVVVRVPTFGGEQWESVVRSMADQARYGAAILSGELPANIEDVFAPLNLRLFPLGAEELACSVTYQGKPVEKVWEEYRRLDIVPDRVKEIHAGERSEGGWNKHVCCAMAIFAEMLSKQGLLIFRLRGLDEEELLERLRQQRAVAGLVRSGGEAVAVYATHVPSGAERVNGPLEDSMETFWSAGEEGERALKELDLHMERPEVEHPLLRRMGASPFEGSRFPMVGLLATCYDLVSAWARGEEVEAAADDGEE